MSTNNRDIIHLAMVLQQILKDAPGFFAKITKWFKTQNFNFTEYELSDMKRLSLIDFNGAPVEHLGEALCIVWTHLRGPD